MKKGRDLAFVSLVTAACAPHGHHHGHHMDKRFEGAEHWAEVFDDPKRDEWQRPSAVIETLELSPAMSVADIGAGTGYFAVRIAPHVPQGKVIAVDVEQDMVRYLGERAAKENITNLQPVLGTLDGPNLPSTVDRVLVVDTYHHIAGREAYFTKLRASLTPGARVVIVDYKADSPIGPPPDHRFPKEQVEKELSSAGYKLLASPDILQNQYVLVFAAN